jgi:hypothetical protein
VEDFITGGVSDEGLQSAALSVLPWLKCSLERAHTDAAAKSRVKELLSEGFFSSNLNHLNLWKDFHAFACQLALKLGGDLHAYHAEHRLGDILGKRLPNAIGRLRLDPVRKDRYEVLQPASKGVAPPPRQDAVMAQPFPRDASKSQVHCEKHHIHFLRMVAMGVDGKFQRAVKDLCGRCSGTFRPVPIKSFQRMKMKCLSRSDYFYDEFPRSARNLDVNRNTASFESVDGLFQFLQMMQTHGQFGAQPIRVKNMFTLDEAHAKQHYHFRAVMVNWLFSPGITYQELAAEVGDAWDRYWTLSTCPRLARRTFPSAGMSGGCRLGWRSNICQTEEPVAGEPASPVCRRNASAAAAVFGGPAEHASDISNLPLRKRRRLVQGVRRDVVAAPPC